MGGTKKRSITSEEKAQAKGAEEQAAKAKSEKGGRSPKHEEYKDRVKDEKEALNQLKTAKSLTLYSVAKALGVTASASNQFLRTLESKGLIVKVGGFSSHFIYKFKE